MVNKREENQLEKCDCATERGSINVPNQATERYFTDSIENEIVF